MLDFVGLESIDKHGHSLRFLLTSRYGAEEAQDMIPKISQGNSELLKARAGNSLPER